LPELPVDCLNARFGELIGKISSENNYFRIGSIFEFISKSSGYFYLGANDRVGYRNDNYGSLTVTVNVKEPQTLTQFHGRRDIWLISILSFIILFQ